MNLAQAIVESRPKPQDAIKPRWATVVSMAPLRIRFDGEDNALNLAPVDLVGVSLHDRVWCQLYAGQVFLVGKPEIDTGWQPHGGTSKAGVDNTGSLMWRKIGNEVFWRGQVWKPSGWATNGGSNKILSNIPISVRPPAGKSGVLTGSGDLSWTNVYVNDDGSMLLFSGNPGTWPVIGGSYLVN